MVSLATLFIPLLALWLWWPLNSLARRTRLVAILVTVVLGLFPALLLKLVQSGAAPYASIAPWQVPGGWVLAVLMLALVLVLLRDASWLLSKLGGAKALARGLHSPQLTGAALMAAGALAALGVHNALQPPQIQEQTVALKNLPPQLSGLRIAVLADIHASPVNNSTYVQTVVDRTLGAQPDLIVLPGDMVDGDVDSGRANVAPLAQLKAPYGVWLAPGNHEYYSGYNSWMAEFHRLGLNVLENRMQLLNINGAKLALSGIGDPVYGRTSPHNADPAQPEGVPPDVEAVARQAQAAQAQFHMLLAHQPKFARDNAAHGIDLQLSGHTHGGLIRGLDQWVVAPVNQGFVRGLYDVGAMKLLVSSGAGLWAGFAMRLGVPPAIEVLTLERAP
ncbi:metallophosphoesterase [Comamonas sp. lk]|uniref:metallophosphoesterase n=1 Tax=Comamonas sp. lk TaxID=2201272 RepID=UPI000EB17372|nr:metallophosphoesterase [Comamonas sp. lk]